jgi:hypothetical protein
VGSGHVLSLGAEAAHLADLELVDRPRTQIDPQWWWLAALSSPSVRSLLGNGRAAGISRGRILRSRTGCGRTKAGHNRVVVKRDALAASGARPAVDRIDQCCVELL